MASHLPPEGITDDFLEQILSSSASPYAPSLAGASAVGDTQGADGVGFAGGMTLHRGPGEGSTALLGAGGPFPLGLNLEHNGGGPSSYVKRVRDDPEAKMVFHGHTKQGGVASAPQPPAPRPKVRARRGQATDPHSIAERLRRERIAERLRALQELVPNPNKVLSMSRLGGAGAVAQLVADIPLSVEGEDGDGGSKQHVWEKWSADGTERQVAKLMEEDIGAAMQLIQSKALCMMPISLAMAIYDSHHQPECQSFKPEPNTPT